MYTIKQPLLILRDEMTIDNKTLEMYFNDIYHLFLNKVVKITHESELSIDEALKTQELFDELIRVKFLLQGTE